MRMSKSYMVFLLFTISFLSPLIAEKVELFSFIPWIDETDNHQVFGIASDFTDSLSGNVLVGRSSKPEFSQWAAGIFSFKPGPVKVRAGFCAPPPQIGRAHV